MAKEKDILNNELLKKLNFALDKSLNQRKYTALINIMNRAGINLPEELKQYINDNKRYSNFPENHVNLIRNLLPDLIKFFKKEAYYKDLLKVFNKYNLNKDHPRALKIQEQIKKLYTSNITLIEFKSIYKQLKELLLIEGLRKVLPQDIPINKIEEFVIKSLKQGISAKDFADNSYKEFITGEYIKKINRNQVITACCNLFITRFSLNADKMQSKVMHNILNIISEEFRLEINTLLDLYDTKLEKSPLLYRAMEGNLSDEKLNELFEHGHRRSENDNDLFLYDSGTNWSPRAGKWEIGGVYATYSPLIAVDYLFEDKGVLMEIKPKNNAYVMYGGVESNLEVAMNQVDNYEIKAIYKVEDYKIKKVFINPYIDKEDNFKPLFKVGESMLSEEILAPRHFSGVNAYKTTNFNKNSQRPNTYKNYEEFLQQHNHEKIILKRDVLLNERGYKTYKEQYDSLPYTPWPAINVKTVLASEEIVKTSSASRNFNPVGFLYNAVKSSIQFIKESISSLTPVNNPISNIFQEVHNKQIPENFSKLITNSNIEKEYNGSFNPAFVNVVENTNVIQAINNLNLLRVVRLLSVGFINVLKDISFSMLSNNINMIELKKRFNTLKEKMSAIKAKLDQLNSKNIEDAKGLDVNDLSDLTKEKVKADSDRYVDLKFSYLDFEDQVKNIGIFIKQKEMGSKANTQYMLNHSKGFRKKFKKEEFRSFRPSDYDLKELENSINNLEKSI